LQIVSKGYVIIVPYYAWIFVKIGIFTRNF